LERETLVLVCNARCRGYGVEVYARRRCHLFGFQSA
jgi:hypothetical protein